MTDTQLPNTNSATGWRAWLLTDTPTSRRHAKMASLYQNWLQFRGNPMAMFGFLSIVSTEK